MLSAFLAGSGLITALATGADYSLSTHHIQWTGSMPTQTHHGLLPPTEFALSIDKSGVAQAMKLPVTLTRNADQSGTLRGTFNRQDFGVNDQNGGFFGAAKDKLIRDEVAVDLTAAQI